MALFCLSAVPPEPLFFRHQPSYTEVGILHHLNDDWRRVNDRRPVILIANDYYGTAQKLRRQGLHAFSMTVTLSGGHLKGLIGQLPVLNESLTAFVLLQSVTLFELREAALAVASQGSLLIEGANLPQGGVDLLQGLGFTQALGRWNRHRIYRRNNMNGTFPRVIQEAA